MPRDPRRWVLLASTEGATAVELALVAPVLLLLIFGTMELARIVGLRSELQDAATAAVRAAVARGVSGSAELRAVAEKR